MQEILKTYETTCKQSKTWPRNPHTQPEKNHCTYNINQAKKTKNVHWESPKIGVKVNTNGFKDLRRLAITVEVF